MNPSSSVTVTSNTTFIYYCEKNKYTISFVGDSNVTINTASISNVEHGTNGSASNVFTISDPNYEFDSVTIQSGTDDSVSYNSSTDTITVSNVQSNVTVSISSRAVTPVTYPQVDSSPVNIPVVEETPVIPTVSVEETTPVFVPNEEVIYAQDQLNPAKPQEIPIPTVSNPVQIIPTEINPTVPPKSSNLGKILLTTLGVGAGAGGAYYLSQKIKKNQSTEESVKKEHSSECSFYFYNILFSCLFSSVNF